MKKYFLLFFLFPILLFGQRDWPNKIRWIDATQSFKDSVNYYINQTVGDSLVGIYGLTYLSDYATASQAIDSSQNKILIVDAVRVISGRDTIPRNTIIELSGSGLFDHDGSDDTLVFYHSDQIVSGSNKQIFDDGLNVRFIDTDGSTVDPRLFGATGDYTGNNAAITKAVQSGAHIKMSAGDYYYTGNFDLATGQTFDGGFANLYCNNGSVAIGLNDSTTISNLFVYGLANKGLFSLGKSKNYLFENVHASMMVANTIRIVTSDSASGTFINVDFDNDQDNLAG